MPCWNSSDGAWHFKIGFFKIISHKRHLLEQMPGNDSEGHTLGVIVKALSCLEGHQG